MRILLTVAVVFLVAAGAQDNDAAIKKDKGLLKGTWKFLSFETAEGKVDDVDTATLVFESDKFEFKKGEDIKKGTYSLNPGGKPREVDFKADDKEMPGIYKFEQETLILCVCMDPGQARPNEFAAKNACVLLTLKRAKD